MGLGKDVELQRASPHPHPGQGSCELCPFYKVLAPRPASNGKVSCGSQRGCWKLGSKLCEADEGGGGFGGPVTVQTPQHSGLASVYLPSAFSPPGLGFLSTAEGPPVPHPEAAVPGECTATPRCPLLCAVCPRLCYTAATGLAPLNSPAGPLPPRVAG